MAVNDYKITDTSTHKVSDVSGTTLSGTVAENKAVFDRLGLFIITKYNGLVDYLRTKGIDTATNTASTSTNGLMSASDKAKLNAYTANPSSLFAVETYTIGVRVTEKTGTKAIAKSGYKPIAIAGWSGSAGTVMVYGARLTASENGSGVIEWRASTESSAQTSWPIGISVLWVKTTA